MSDCKAENFWSATVSACWLRATLMSTMLPEWMSGGRRMEGNSIYKGIVISISASKVGICRSCLYIRMPSGMDGDGWGAMSRTYKTFVFGEEHGDSSVDLADSQ